MEPSVLRGEFRKRHALGQQAQETSCHENGQGVDRDRIRPVPARLHSFRRQGRQSREGARLLAEQRHGALNQLDDFGGGFADEQASGETAVLPPASASIATRPDRPTTETIACISASTYRNMRFFNLRGNSIHARMAGQISWLCCNGGGNGDIKNDRKVLLHRNLIPELADHIRVGRRGCHVRRFGRLPLRWAR